MTGKTFKPMITLADVPNSDYAHYVPYAKSNKELTEDVANINTVKYGFIVKGTITSADDFTAQSRLSTKLQSQHPNPSQ
jgi:hypothetical protein